MLRWMIGIKRNETIRAEETRAGVANISDNIREESPRWLEHI